MRTVAALFIDPRGPYPKMPGVECWDESRDARLYDGPHPIVAHPPCGPWSKQRHNYRGSEHDCAPRALEQVRKFGGVLEHPAESALWEELLPGHVGRFYMPFTCPQAAFHVDPFGGYSLFVTQVEFGHVARKPTWLYLVRVPLADIKPPPFPGRQPTHWCSGNRACKTGGSVPPGIKVCSAQQRRRTPRAFAEWLVSLARSAT